MIPKEAIEKAIEGGWSWSKHGITRTVDSQGDVYSVGKYANARIALDPSFWQALGKALGWKRRFVMRSYGTTGEKNDDDAEYEFDGIQSDDLSAPDRPTEEWVYRARCFYDLILTGGDTDAFWKELLSLTIKAANGSCHIQIRAAIEQS